ncbi:MAG: hypothetical protein R2744_04380 [Bacteroidales bacterium]
MISILETYVERIPGMMKYFITWEDCIWNMKPVEAEKIFTQLRETYGDSQ